MTPPPIEKAPLSQFFTRENDTHRLPLLVSIVLLTDDQANRDLARQEGLQAYSRKFLTDLLFESNVFVNFSAGIRSNIQSSGVARSSRGYRRAIRSWKGYWQTQRSEPITMNITHALLSDSSRSPFLNICLCPKSNVVSKLVNTFREPFKPAEKTIWKPTCLFKTRRNTIK